MESSLEARRLRPEEDFGVAVPVRAGGALGVAESDFVISGKQAKMTNSSASLGRWTPRASSVAMKVGRRYLCARCQSVPLNDDFYSSGLSIFVSSSEVKRTGNLPPVLWAAISRRL